MAQPSLKPLSAAETAEILSAGPSGVLVGGSALAYWATYFNLVPPSALSAGITSDLDFLGSSAEANAFAKRLDKTLPNKITSITATLDDQTPNAAKILIYRFHGRSDAVEIDYLRQLHGFTSQSEKTLRRRAMRVILDDETKVLVMHPLDVLRSKVLNLASLHGRQGTASQAQCKLATSVAHEFLKTLCGFGEAVQRKSGLKAVEEIAALARSPRGVHVTVRYKINLLDTVPSSAFASVKFQERRWPQIVRYVEGKVKKAHKADDVRNERAKRAKTRVP